MREGRERLRVGKREGEEEREKEIMRECVCERERESNRRFC